MGSELHYNTTSQQLLNILKTLIIFDYRDSKIDYFEKMLKQRNRYYKKLSKQVQID